MREDLATRVIPTAMNRMTLELLVRRNEDYLKHVGDEAAAVISSGDQPMSGLVKAAVGVGRGKGTTGASLMIFKRRTLYRLAVADEGSQLPYFKATCFIYVHASLQTSFPSHNHYSSYSYLLSSPTSLHTPSCTSSPFLYPLLSSLSLIFSSSASSYPLSNPKSSSEESEL